jgi:hypothetical protein
MTFMLAAVWWTGGVAMAETPWPLKAPADLKALHGPTFTGAQILTSTGIRSSRRHRRSRPRPSLVSAATSFFVRTVKRGSSSICASVASTVRRTSYPMAANIVFWDTELANRVALAKAAATAGISGVFDPFWGAVELKMTTPGDSLPAVETRNDGEHTVVSYKGEEVLRWRPASEPLPPASAAHLSHALLWLLPVHPLLSARLAMGGKAPEHLNVRQRIAGQLKVDDFQLTESRWCETCDALPADAQPVPWSGAVRGGFEDELVPIMVAASEGKFKPLSSDDYLQRAKAALERGATLEAFLWLLERHLQDGTQRCEPGDTSERCRVQNRLVEQIRTNADVQVLQRNMTTRSIEAARAIAELRDKVGANAYYIDLASMNAIPEAALRFKSAEQEPLKSAQQQMKSALAAMPMVPAVYRDIGLIYFAAVDPWRAWFAWEMGTANPGRTAESELWGFVHNIDRQVRQRRPEFF